VSVSLGNGGRCSDISFLHALLAGNTTKSYHAIGLGIAFADKKAQRELRWACLLFLWLILDHFADTPLQLLEVEAAFIPRDAFDGGINAS
jgi:hypothetical protein